MFYNTMWTTWGAHSTLTSSSFSLPFLLGGILANFYSKLLKFSNTQQSAPINTFFFPSLVPFPPSCCVCFVMQWTLLQVFKILNITLLVKVVCVTSLTLSLSFNPLPLPLLYAFSLVLINCPNVGLKTKVSSQNTCPLTIYLQLLPFLKL